MNSSDKPKFNANGGISINDIIDAEYKFEKQNLWDSLTIKTNPEPFPGYYNLNNNTIDIDYVDITNEPQHIAFLGHDLNHK